MVTVGITAFVIGGNVSSEHAQRGTSIYGIFLLLAFLGFDGFTSTFQEKLFREDKMSKYNQMLYMNACSAAIAIISLQALNEIPYCFRFVRVHEGFIWHVFTLSVSAAAGQYYIFSMVQEFGALALAATMNLRQVTTICTSYLLHPQHVTYVQVLGLFTVFAALLLKTYLGHRRAKQKQKHLAGSTSPKPSGDEIVPEIALKEMLPHRPNEPAEISKELEEGEQSEEDTTESASLIHALPMHLPSERKTDFESKQPDCTTMVGQPQVSSSSATIIGHPQSSMQH
eukprot:TRINITY_DN60927_c0_g1_i1.p1 TRINITY_DN60927_c0_g1~~TRINITY_DN60927_c0_g1_i1.p1  ORF type:complete len:299 (+),score=57.49 TRINITY_DN60927_c0_g1_i1:46-897(+)